MWVLELQRGYHTHPQCMWDLVRQVLYPLSLLSSPSPSSLNCGQWLYQRRKDWMSKERFPNMQLPNIQKSQVWWIRDVPGSRSPYLSRDLPATVIPHIGMHTVHYVCREAAPEHSLRHLISAARLLQAMQCSVSTIHTKLSSLPDTEGLNYRKQRQNVSLASFLSMNQAGISLGYSMLGCLILKSVVWVIEINFIFKENY